MASHKTTQKMLLTLQDIADLADVSKPAVANWRKRHGDFPQPTLATRTERTPEFIYNHIVEWLINHEKVTKKSLEGKAAEITFKALTAELRKAGFAYEHALAGMVLVSLCANSIDARDMKTASVLQAWADSLGLLPQTLEVVTRLLGAVDSEQLTSLAEITSGALEQRQSQQLVEDLIDFFSQRNNNGWYLGAELAGSADVMPRLAGALAGLQQPLASIYDPFVGKGSSLIASVKQSEAIQIFASDINLYSVAFSDLRMKLHGLEADLHQANVFELDSFAGVKADFAFVEGPWGSRLGKEAPAEFSGRALVALEYLPKSQRDEALTLMDVASHLSDDGWGYVLTPLALVGQARFERFRNALIAQGCVVALIELPGGVAKSTQIPMVLWVLRAPGRASGSVTLVDASQVKDIVKSVERAVAALHKGKNPRMLLSQTVTLGEALADSEFSWLPSVAMKVEPTRADFEQQLVSVAEKITVQLNALNSGSKENFTSTLEPVESASLVSLADLKDQAVQLLVLNDVTEGKKVWRLMPSTPDRLKLEDVQIDEDFPVLRPGDLVVWLMNGLRAVVVPDDSYEYVVKSPAQVFRLNQSVWNPHYLAAMISYQTPHTEVGSAMNRVRLKDVSVRQLPLAQQDALVQRFVQFEEMQLFAEQLNESIAEFKNALADMNLAD